MLFSLLLFCEFVEFIRRSMGLFSCCFRIRDDHRPQINRVSQSITPITKEPADHLASDPVWSVLDSEAENRDLSQCKDDRFGVTGSPVVDEELRTEAKFGKACETLSETPVAIRQTEKPKDAQLHNGNTEPAFHSCLPNTTAKKIFEKQPDQLQSPIKLSEKLENVADSSSHSSTRFSEPATSTQGNNKYVHWSADGTPFTPRWGDGNGIPNTTKKYREDQKVSWHATPFEQRLEKALMEEDKFIPKRQRGVTSGMEV
ncbi:hypothetical protein SSX86_020651 [Deinandra increscens subsp. villosa]|uniref:Breast cancer susceptibility 1 n=1 Tax=Deinandra increscens subsp. villosa TaxID=3103831 RepID=A0AAP0CTH7_9ASTR